MFVFLTTDPFNNPKKQSDQVREALGDEGSRVDNTQSIRRPYRGIQIKEDTYSTIAIRYPSGESIPIASSSSRSGQYGGPTSGKVDEYSDFILQSVQDQRMEKQQIIETFGDPYIYFLGERPRIMQFSGMLMNSEDFNWRSQFWYNYERYLRGTKLVQSNARAYVSWDTIVVEGYVLSAQATEDANDQHNVPFGLSMVVTNYYDHSNIPTTRFPGWASADPNLEVLNQKLMDKRSNFVSTTAQVRHANYRAGFVGKGVLGTLRSGIRKINEMTTVASNFMNTVDRVLGGRTVRLPPGISGYLHSVGNAVIGAGGTTDAQTKQYNAVTGQFENAVGSVRLRVPAYSMFAQPWISPITKTHRGHIFENIDEYPKYTQEKSVMDLLSKGDKSYYQEVLRKRQTALENYKASVLNHRILEESGGALEGLSEAVNFARSNFGMVMSAAAFIRDPLPIIQNTLGLGQIVEFENGAFTVRDKALKERLSQFVGIEAVESFAGAMSGAPVDISGQIPFGEETQMGQSYQDGNYQGGNGQIGYEPVYGNSDYSALVEADPESQDSLDEIFGDSDSAPDGTDVSVDSFDEVYGKTSSSSTASSLAEIISMLTYTGEARDEDTLGIRGVADVDSLIDPIK